MIEGEDTASFAGALRRLAALALDFVIMGAPVAFVGLIAPDVLRSLGPWGRPIGACLALAYFTIGNSVLTGGRTLGKFLLGLRVVRPDGQAVTVPRSFVRAVVLLLPLALNGQAWPAWVVTNKAFMISIGLVVFGALTCLGYLFLFNRPSRRCLHDLVARTAVLRWNSTPWRAERLKRIHVIVCGIVLVAASVAPSVLERSFGASLEPLTLLVEEAATVPSVWSPMITLRSSAYQSWTSASRGQASGVLVTAKSTGSPADFREVAAQLAQPIVDSWPSDGYTDYLQIEIDYGFDLFVYKSARIERLTESPEAWRRALGIAKPAVATRDSSGSRAVRDAQPEPTPEEVEAFQAVKAKAVQGDVEAQSALGRAYADGRGIERDFTQAAEWWRKAAERGDAEGQSQLGSLYYSGQGVSQDFEQAIQLWRKAAEQGHPEAQNNLGVGYYKGQGVSQDFEKAVQWFRKAAEQGHPGAQRGLGFMYERGEGVEQNYGQATQWYGKAAEQGEANAQHNLGVMYEHGRGIAQSLAKAALWYRKAAEQGHVYAQYNLGVMHKHGRGVPQDDAQAAMWWRQAAEQGFTPAIAALKETGVP